MVISGYQAQLPNNLQKMRRKVSRLVLG